MKCFLLIIAILFFAPLPLKAASYDIRGELSEWFTYRDNVPHNYFLGLRYMPELTLKQSISREGKLDFMASVNANFEVPSDNLVINNDTSESEFYRLWGRWSTRQFEARGGLQKINFGPARILRSLMWFDRIDPRDPFGLTEGVKGLLLRYYFLDNSNIWLWGLYGNDEIKGLEMAATDKSSPEFGGRYQFPLSMGEMAFSFHHRKVEKKWWPDGVAAMAEKAREDRLALDAFWDIGVGLWFEAVASMTRIERGHDLGALRPSDIYAEFITVGADYTFDTGIHFLGEHFIKATGPDWDETASVRSVSAISADYGISIYDSINTIITYDWIIYERQGFVGWQRTYDNWRINLLGFGGPKRAAGKFGGDGLQIILTYNH